MCERNRRRPVVNFSRGMLEDVGKSSPMRAEREA